MSTTESNKIAEDLFKKWSALPNYKKIDKDMETSLMVAISDAVSVEQLNTEKFKKALGNIKDKLREGIHKLNVRR